MKDLNKFKGLFSALLTPFNADASFNPDAMKKLVEFNLENGIDGFYVGGSTGEGLLLTNEERKETLNVLLRQQRAGQRLLLMSVRSIRMLQLIWLNTLKASAMMQFPPLHRIITAFLWNL